MSNSRKPRYAVAFKQGPRGGYVVVDHLKNMQVVGPFALKEVAEAAARKRNGRVDRGDGEAGSLAAVG